MAGQSARPSGPAYPGTYPWIRADQDFITGMISHHAQAIVMGNMAPERAGSKAMRTLCARVVNSQSDEIVIMQQWLKDRGLPVPPAKPVPMKIMMNGVEHEMMMPGMLTDAQLKEMEDAQGVAFDSLFLTYMIPHHEGAISMVNTLNSTPGASQDQVVFRLAADIYADQTAEIERMQAMLTQLPLR
jgi:uncharacterized protein (DUF305 family)